MKQVTLRGSADLYLGLLLLFISGVMYWYVSDLEIGTVRRMGTGFFPLVLIIILAGFGIILTVRGILTKSVTVAPITLRPLIIILGSFVAFALLVDRIGLIGAIFAQVAVAHFASSETSAGQSIVFAIVLAALSSAIFVGLLRMPVELLP